MIVQWDLIMRCLSDVELKFELGEKLLSYVSERDHEADTGAESVNDIQVPKADTDRCSRPLYATEMVLKRTR